MSTGVANYKIKLNGSPLSKEFIDAVEEVAVEDEINLPTMFSIKLNLVDYSSGNIHGIDLKTFKPGDKISISIGLDDVDPMVSGEITSIEVILGEHSLVELRGYDLLHKLRMGTRSKAFTKKKDSEIASEIAKEHGLTIEADETKTVYPFIFQNNQSNYEFLLERATNLDYEIYVEDKKLYFVKSRSQKDPKLADMAYRKDFDSLTLELRTLTRGSKIEVRGWDVKDKKGITGEAKKGAETSKMGGKESGFEFSVNALGESPIAIPAEYLVDLNEAKNIAAAAYNSLIKEFITGEGKCWGNQALRAGQTVKLLGIDDRFNGTYYIVSTVHAIDSNGYTTTFKVKRTGI
ncbi:MAG: contractile injection system protein, VgrG/Pvc8 family [Bacillota bacterium]|nr:contractile injection system protein, VgrG/Pvc8 family [Bacillota bacterium]